MPKFHYTAVVASTGREVRGTIEEPDATQASVRLKAEGLFPIALQSATALERTPARRRGSWRRDRLRAPEQRAFTRQLATLLQAGVPMLRGLETLAVQTQRRGAHLVLTGLAETIRTGGRLSDGLERYPRVFGPLYGSLVRAGEAAGTLGPTLENLARTLEKAARLRGRLAAALAYPLIVLLIATAIAGALLVLVVPRFEQIFAGLLPGQPLPPLTQVVIDLGRGLQDQGIWLLAALALAGLGGRALHGLPAGRHVVDRLFLRLPLLGRLHWQAATARCTRTLGSLLSADVPVLSALLITRDTSGNRALGAALARTHDRVRAGEGLAPSLQQERAFPPLAVSMIAVGEETGTLPAMLSRIADTYEEEVDTTAAALTALIEPLLIVGLAALVGTLVLALFLPILHVLQGLG